MGSTESDIVRKAEAILAAAKKYNGDRQERYELMKQLDVLYLDLEDPVDALMRQWTFVGISVDGSKSRLMSTTDEHINVPGRNGQDGSL